MLLVLHFQSTLVVHINLLDMTSHKILLLYKKPIFEHTVWCIFDTFIDFLILDKWLWKIQFANMADMFLLCLRTTNNDKCRGARKLMRLFLRR